MPKKTHTVPNAEIKWNRKKRPVVHLLRHDPVTDTLRTAAVAIPENPLDDDEATLFCLLINGKGKIVVDSVSRQPVIVTCPPLVVGLLDEPNRLLNRNEVASITGLSIPTIKRAEKTGQLGKVRISERRVGYPSYKIDEWIASRQAKRRA
jgi:predicted DNA-binding transcriptional regulator AlpA